jgi:hypothetical protein
MPKESGAQIADQTPEHIGKEEGKYFVDALVSKQSNQYGFAEKTDEC